jgi:hypothetical protein
MADPKKEHALMIPGPERTPEEIGGGSGGGPDSTNQAQAIDGRYSITANQISLVSRTPLPPAIPGPNVITLVAGNVPGTDGLVNVRGGQGVRITAGPPLLLPTASESTNGVEIAIGEMGKFTLQRGLLPIDQKMEITQEGVTIDAGASKVTIKSMTEITLSVAEGMTKIKLGPEGVTIEALQIKLSAQVQAEIQALMNKITGTAMNQISGGITMIG